MTKQLPVRPRSLFWRTFTLILIIVSLFSVVNVVILGIETLDRPGRPAPGELLYASTFDAYNQEWSQFPGQMSSQIVDGSLVIKVDAAQNGAYSVLDHDFSDFDVRIDAKRVAANDPYNEIGLLFRYRDRDNYYMFKILGDGSYCVERWSGGKLEILSACHPSPAVLPGLNAVNQIRVVGRGNRFQFYVNDQALILCPKGSDKYSTWSGDQCLSNNKKTSPMLIDDTFDYGKIGVGVRVRTPGIQVAFDNVLVCGPKPMANP
jgi:hypothetical protein